MPIFIKHSFELHAVTYYNYNDSIYPVDRDVSTSVPFPDSVEERNDIVWKEDSVSGNSGRLMTSTSTNSPEQLRNPIEVLQRLSPLEMVYKFSAFIPSLEDIKSGKVRS